MPIYQADVSDYSDLAAAFATTGNRSCDLILASLYCVKLTITHCFQIFSDAGIVLCRSFQNDGLPISSLSGEDLRIIAVSLDRAFLTAYLALHYMSTKGRVAHFSSCIISPFQKGIRVNYLCLGFSHITIARPGLLKHSFGSIDPRMTT
jgi:hypothetical protein